MQEVDVSSQLSALQRSAPVPAGVRVHDPNPFLPQDLSLKAKPLPQPGTPPPLPSPSPPAKYVDRSPSA